MAIIHKNDIFAQNASKPEQIKDFSAFPLWKSTIFSPNAIVGLLAELGMQSWATCSKRMLVFSFLCGTKQSLQGIFKISPTYKPKISSPWFWKMQHKWASQPLLVTLLCSKPSNALKFVNCGHVDFTALGNLGPTQVNCRLLISSIFDALNFQHFLEMLEFNL